MWWLTFHHSEKQPVRKQDGFISVRNQTDLRSIGERLATIPDFEYDAIARLTPSPRITWSPGTAALWGEPQPVPFTHTDEEF
jgi:hypothetical protein